jgi:hypothetical protein
MRLLTLDIDSINKVVEEYDNESKAIKEELFRICWYMRGASFTEAYLLSYEDRLIISKIIEKNLEITKETQLPFF